MPEDQRFPQVFALELDGEDRFTTRLRGFEGRSFGGQTLGCATVAAARTCEGRALHSLHACFMRMVPAEKPIELAVERLRDGRRFSHRRVQIRDAGRLLCELITSFTVPGQGPDYQDASPRPGTPAPETLPDEEVVAHSEGWEHWGPGPFELRWVGRPWRPQPRHAHSRYETWLKPRFPLAPEDRDIYAGAVAFLSDFHSHWSVMRKLGLGFEPVGFVSLDQVIWLHRDLAWDDWRLLVSESEIAHGGRALTRRSLFTRDGRLVASMAQEALIPPEPEGRGG